MTDTNTSTNSKFKTTWFYASLSSEEKEVGLISKKIEKTYSERSVNFDEFADELQKRYEEFDSDGYDVVNIVPISMGQTEMFDLGSKNKGSVGFSITRGAVIVGKKRNTKDDV
ncbi:MAG: hypothetical protein L3J75_15930 [Methylococcaceae bacterium]|nr:hypothetical protein [Methylococcaceae bacterium]